MSSAIARPMMQLLCIVVAALAIPTALCHNGWLEKRLRLREPKLKPVMRASAGIQDAAGGQKRLRQESPEWILVGNSMLNCRVDNAELEALTGHQLYKLSFSGTKSAMWYLMLKTIVVPSGAKPKVVTIVFRDRDLTRPTVRVIDNAAMIERLHGRDLPEWQQVLGTYEASLTSSWTKLTTRVGDGFDTLMPSTKWNEWARNKVQKTAFNLSAFGDNSDYPVRREQRNDLLSMNHLRKSSDGADNAEDDEADKKDTEPPISFDPSPDQSFLPHMVKLAQQAGFQLHFHRIKTNPDMAPPMDEVQRTRVAYLADLKAWLEAQGCYFTDESGEPEITGRMFVDTIHIHTAPENRQAYQKIFWRQVQPLIDDLMRNAGSAPKTAP